MHHAHLQVHICANNKKILFTLFFSHSSKAQCDFLHQDGLDSDAMRSTATCTTVMIRALVPNICIAGLTQDELQHD